MKELTKECLWKEKPYQYTRTSYDDLDLVSKMRLPGEFKDWVKEQIDLIKQRKE